MYWIYFAAILSEYIPPFIGRFEKGYYSEHAVRITDTVLLCFVLKIKRS